MTALEIVLAASGDEARTQTAAVAALESLFGKWYPRNRLATDRLKDLASDVFLKLWKLGRGRRILTTEEEPVAMSYLRAAARSTLATWAREMNWKDVDAESLAETLEDPAARDEMARAGEGEDTDKILAHYEALFARVLARYLENAKGNRAEWERDWRDAVRMERGETTGEELLRERGLPASALNSQIQARLSRARKRVRDAGGDLLAEGKLSAEHYADVRRYINGLIGDEAVSKRRGRRPSLGGEKP